MWQGHQTWLAPRMGAEPGRVAVSGVSLFRSQNRIERGVGKRVVQRRAVAGEEGRAKVGGVGWQGAMESSMMHWSQCLVPRGELVGGVFRLQMSVGLISYSLNRVAAECCGSVVGHGSWWLAE